jgi:preprotein translocase subunit SecE
MADAKKENAFIGFFKRLSKFFKDCNGEIKKIVWPQPKEVWKNVAVVVVVIAIAAVVIFGLDELFMNLLSLVMSVAGV